MTTGESKLYVVARRPSGRGGRFGPCGSAAPLPQAASEIETLRAINAHLVRQIAELKQSMAQAQRLADRDGLTGLYNRRKCSICSRMH